MDLAAGGRRKRILMAAHAALWPLRMGWAVANRQGWLGAPPVGSAPTLDPDALARWRSAIAGATVYLEYGAGGSTVEATRSVQHVVSVETDARYLAAVERRVSELPGRALLHPVAVDIGWTWRWGKPVMAWPTPGRVERWRRYPSAPWIELEKLGLLPDFILVDGRFRVASILESFLRLPEGSSCLIMLDDFRRRAEDYGSVLRFAQEVETVGRAIAFRRRQGLDRAECLKALEAAYRDPR